MDASLPATPSGSPPIGALARELTRIQERQALLALGIAVVVGLAGPLLVLRAVENGLAGREDALLWLWLAAAVAIGSIAVACAIVAFLPSLLLRGDDRTASVVHAWVGAREVRRLFGSTGGAFKIPTTPERIEAWLASNPDTPELRFLRFELLVMTRRYEEARSLIDRYPRMTPFDEHRITEAHALIDDQSTGQVDEPALRAAAARVPAGDDRAEAMASLGVFLARRLVGSGDWRAPLVAARPYITGSDVGILVRDFGSTVFNYLWPRIVLPVGALVIVIAVLVTVMALT